MNKEKNEYNEIDDDETNISSQNLIYFQDSFLNSSLCNISFNNINIENNNILSSSNDSSYFHDIINQQKDYNMNNLNKPNKEHKIFDLLKNCI